MKKQGLYLLMLVYLLSALCGCTDEREATVAGNSGGQQVHFSVRVPGATAPKTKALTADDENEVDHIVLLLFTTAGGYTHYPINITSVTTNSSNSAIKTFTASIPQGTYDLVILANSSQIVNAALGSINAGDSKASVMQRLLLSNAGQWNTDPAAPGYKKIPMWGEISGLTVSTATGSQSVSLTRMLARIDVLISPSTQSDFKLTSVRLYNYNDQGQVAPDDANWNRGTTIATAPTVPATANKPANPGLNPLVYDGRSITTTDIACENEIYTFEAEAGAAATPEDNTCLVIGGIYGSDTQVTYYKVEFANTVSSVTTYLPLLRNHRYLVKVNDVDGSGQSDPEAAFNGPAVNITATILDWNESQITDIVFDGQNYLGVSQGEFTFSSDARTAAREDNILSIITDCPGGWTIDKIADAAGNTSDWLDATVKAGAAGPAVDTKLTMSQNSGTSERIAFVHLSAGRLKYVVKVTQEISAALSLNITDSSGNPVSQLEFFAAKDTQPAAQEFHLAWTPIASPLTFVSTAIGTAFTFSTGTGLTSIPASGSLTDASATHDYNIQPPAITTAQLNADPFLVRSSIWFYSVSNGISSINKSLTLRQGVYNMIPMVASMYLMDGNTKSFAVRSNSPFTVTVKEDPDNVLTLPTATYPANISAAGQTVYFGVIDDMTTLSVISSSPVVTISSPTGLFADVDVPLFCASALLQPKSNSYIVAPGSIPILIPVDRCNDSDLGTQLGATEAFTAEMVWTDNANGMAANSNIASVTARGSGQDGKVMVYPGSAAGNAVVCIKNTAGEILWSWHIWVTSINIPNPAAGTFMTCNVGALSIAPGNSDFYGLQYQWGRKDPFNGPSAINATTRKTYYGPSGASFTQPTTTYSGATAPNYNLLKSVRNPEQLITGTFSWYGGSSIPQLWTATKSVYDPCPPGWRIPSDASSTQSAYSAMTAANSPWSAGMPGRASSIGSLPATGYGNFNDAGIAQAGVQGIYPGTTITSQAGGLARALFFSSTQLLPNNQNYITCSAPARCIKE
ncbi:FimB/Mfa2 family fimbrial subunit [Dysgonomonas reticulitermitis]